jgi:putative FmdB family regulatory protein
MPHYEFFCHGCKKAFSKVFELAECEEGSILCPHCGSDDVEQRWFYSTTARKSA